ncbi:ArsR/SmtB family transcription factor [Paenirhodobacter enshiensis]|uniref:ArsR family transcriptional regulator n=1 Tax=Paenirhodobacter enshiensis TaxID=1105367 RepID=A0A086Y5Z5_9RHOB|nr:metalloregulator ArsR/SmtB family transcription factor [Paenirhodobacter enshiensis]KFI29695.1 ArsR family transcriptional regulator [Paenirhodobacter enshiensis]
MSGPGSSPLDAVFAALSDPTRRAILTMLLEDDMAVTDVAEPFRMSLAAISKHLQILAEAGLISQEKRGRVKWCKLEPQGMTGAITWIESFGQLDPMDFDAFERFLEVELSETEVTALTGDDATDDPETEETGIEEAAAKA